MNEKNRNEYTTKTVLYFRKTLCKHPPLLTNLAVSDLIVWKKAVKKPNENN